MVIAPQKTPPLQDEGTQHIRAGNIALQEGRPGQALGQFVLATRKAPNNHRYKVHLCEFLKNISFPNHEPAYQKVILTLLETDLLDHQCLWRPWLSLLINDPAMETFCKLMNGENYNLQDLQHILETPYLLKGVEKCVCIHMPFERALRTIRSLIDSQKIKSEKFSAALDIYNFRTENLLADITEFLPDYEIDSSIPALGRIDDSTSQDVRTQYEQSPYPRWTSYHILPPRPGKEDQETYDHLIAGCGTGFSTCMTAMLYPHARITAFDLSRASLTYAKQKAEEFNFNDIEFYQADILDLDDLNKKFDLIECSGVLHHMKDPLEGWRCLIKKLKPDGKMHIGLYSELDRADIVAARKYIAEQKFDTTPEGIKAAREAIADLPADHTARQVLDRRDFYNLSGCRDLLFHVQEHRFTIRQIKQSLQELGLVFDHFNMGNKATRRLYRQRFPQDQDMNNLDNWEILERDNPNIFRGMYQFWCHLR